jgi:hypothetical protein
MDTILGPTVDLPRAGTRSAGCRVIVLTRYTGSLPLRTSLQNICPLLHANPVLNLAEKCGLSDPEAWYIKSPEGA